MCIRDRVTVVGPSKHSDRPDPLEVFCRMRQATKKQKTILEVSGQHDRCWVACSWKIIWKHGYPHRLREEPFRIARLVIRARKESSFCALWRNRATSIKTKWGTTSDRLFWPGFSSRRKTTYGLPRYTERYCDEVLIRLVAGGRWCALEGLPRQSVFCLKNRPVR